MCRRRGYSNGSTPKGRSEIDLREPGVRTLSNSYQNQIISDRARKEAGEKYQEETE